MCSVFLQSDSPNFTTWNIYEVDRLTGIRGTVLERDSRRFREGTYIVLVPGNLNFQYIEWSDV